MPDKFYTNKEIYEKFTAEVANLQESLRKTNEKLVKYNGLHDRFDDVDDRLEGVEGQLGVLTTRQAVQERKCAGVLAKAEGKSDTWSQIGRVWPIIVQTAMAAFTIWIALRAAG